MRLYCSVQILVAIAIDFPVTLSFISRIINGQNVDIKDFPYIVSLQKYNSDKKDYSHFCGGSIISKNAILTAAHCVFNELDTRMWSIRAGSTYRNKNLESYDVRKIIIHPMYESENFNYDLAVLLIENEFKLRKGIEIICLATPNYKINTEDLAAVSGWGTTEFSTLGSNNLQFAEVYIISHFKCRKDYYLFNEVTNAMLCAGTMTPEGKVRDSCQGDSGGPLVHKGFLVGVVSWGYKCGLPDYPGVYARVSIAYEWIKENSETIQ